MERARAGGASRGARVKLDALVLEEKPLPQMPGRGRRGRRCSRGVRELGLEALPWDREARDLQARIAFVRARARRGGRGDWPAVDDAALAANLGGVARALARRGDAARRTSRACPARAGAAGAADAGSSSASSMSWPRRT